MASAEALYTRHTSTLITRYNNLQKENTEVGTDNEEPVVPHETSEPIRKHSCDSHTEVVAFTGEDVENIPSHLWLQFGKSARRLDLSYNRLRSLAGIEHFKVLEELILDNNELTDSALILPSLPYLHTLTLNKNQIVDTEALLATLEKQCPALKYLSLLGNRACPHEILQSGHDDEDYQRYRYFVLHRLPNLTFLDSTNVTSNERKEAKRVGAFMRVVRPSDIVENKKVKLGTSGDMPSGYNPLPASRDVVGQHRGVYGQCKYVYYGKHSEGNRFIRNHQL